MADSVTREDALAVLRRFIQQEIDAAHDRGFDVRDADVDLYLQRTHERSPQLVDIHIHLDVPKRIA